MFAHRTFSLRLRKFLVILSMVFFSSSGDALLARGMKRVGGIDIHHLGGVFSALSNPFVILGIVFLLGFMYSYMTALSFADLSYVLPATAVSYVLMVLLSIVWLHEHVSFGRWAGVAFIVLGVGFVAGGPIRTEHGPSQESEAVGAGDRI
jgi:drug/metabolite transporter (DMT)-like permease